MHTNGSRCVERSHNASRESKIHTKWSPIRSLDVRSLLHALRGPSLYDRLPNRCDRSQSREWCHCHQSRYLHRVLNLQSKLPYQNINMVEIRDEVGQQLVDSVRSPYCKPPSVIFAKPDRPAGPACQNACPHDALIRIDMSDLKKLGKWMGRKAA